MEIPTKEAPLKADSDGPVEDKFEREGRPGAV